MKTLEIRPTSIKVETSNGTMLVARYNDENGSYFFNEKLEKQYAKVEKLSIKKESSLTEYVFNVEYAHKGSDRGSRQKDTRVKARDYKEALEKVNRKFKTIYEISEI